ncbi:MAG TPA: hypothetical protein VIM53_04915 [Candidatus Saccharimonadales bacterium]
MKLRDVDQVAKANPTDNEATAQRRRQIHGLLGRANHHMLVSWLVASWAGAEILTNDNKSSAVIGLGAVAYAGFKAYTANAVNSVAAEWAESLTIKDQQTAVEHESVGEAAQATPTDQPLTRELPPSE